MGYRITKPSEQVRAEATAAAAEELVQIMKVIELAGCTRLVEGPSGCASLISTAAHLYERHTSLIEADAFELVDDAPDYDSLGESLSAPFGSPLLRPIAGGSTDYLRIAREAEAQYRRRTQKGYPEPEPAPTDGLAVTICLRCAQPMSDHVDNACPCP